jgi:hypothetical protein
MPVEEDDCWDTALLWTATFGVDPQGGATFAAPVQLTYPNGVRWLPTARQVLDAAGNLTALDAQAVVLQDIAIGSLMWLGSLSDWYGTGSGSGPVNTADDARMVVKTFSKTPSIDGRFYRRVVGLMRYHQ